MNIIHSSSTAYSQPVAFTKPQSGGDNSAVKHQATSGNAQAEKPAGTAKDQPSSTEAFENALGSAGLDNIKNYHQSQNLTTPTRKALHAYTENHLQAARLQITDNLAGIDLYA